VSKVSFFCLTAFVVDVGIREKEGGREDSHSPFNVHDFILSSGPAMMPGGDAEAYTHLQPIVEKVAAQTTDGACVTYIGPGGAGNFVKMVHNGIEYGDMQLISEAYDVLKTVGKLTNDELAAVFDDWNKSELESFLVEITASIFKKKDEKAAGFLVDKVLDKTGMKVRKK